MSKESINWSGVKTGKLTGIRQVQTNPSKWLFKCDCGKDTIAFSKNVKRGHTKSCGCARISYVQSRKGIDSRIEKPCKHCNEAFLGYAKKRPNEGKFCSNICKYAYARSPIVSFVCIHCNVAFGKKHHRLMHDKGKFCSRKCQYAYNQGSNHPNYKGGNISQEGYRRIRVDKKLILEHRHVMERHEGRKLKPTEHIHHIDGNKLNNSIANLMIVSNREHQAIHRYGIDSLQHLEQRRMDQAA